MIEIPTNVVLGVLIFFLAIAGIVWIFIICCREQERSVELEEEKDKKAKIDFQHQTDTLPTYWQEFFVECYNTEFDYYSAPILLEWLIIKSLDRMAIEDIAFLPHLTVESASFILKNLHGKWRFTGFARNCDDVLLKHITPHVITA